jgi:hypothetical protein
MLGIHNTIAGETTNGQEAGIIASAIISFSKIHPAKDLLYDSRV